MASTSQTINSILGTVRRTGSGLTGRATNAVRSTLTTVRSTTRSTPSRRTTYARNNNSNRSSSRNSRSSGRSSGGSSGGSSGTSNNFQPINTLPTLQNNDISTIPTPTTTPSQPKTISNSNPQLNNQLAQIERYGTPTGTKIQTETFQGLAGKGALGSALRLEAEAINPWTGRQGSLDPVLALRKVGLGLASIPAEAGQLIGSSTARFFGQKPVFKEDQDYIFSNQQGTSTVTQSYSAPKALKQTQIGFQQNPLGTTIDIGLKAITLIPIASIPAKAGARLLKGQVKHLPNMSPQQNNIKRSSTIWKANFHT